MIEVLIKKIHDLETDLTSVQARRDEELAAENNAMREYNDRRRRRETTNNELAGMEEVLKHYRAVLDNEAPSERVTVPPPE